MIAESPSFRQQLPPGTWNADGVMVVTNAGALARVPASGGAPTADRTGCSRRGELPRLSAFPARRAALLYTAFKALTPLAVYAISLDRPSARQKVMDAGSNVQYADRALLFMRGTSLMAQPFDPTRFTASGAPAVIADNLMTNIAIHFGGAFSASPTGALVYQGLGGQGDTPAAGMPLVWRTPSGTTQALIDEPGTYRHLAIAPDGRHALVTKLDARGSDLWTIDLQRGVRTRAALTSDVSQLAGAVLSADGRSFVVSLSKGQGLDLYRKPNDAATAELLLLADDQSKLAVSMSGDGRFLLYDTVSRDTGGDIWSWRWTVRPSLCRSSIRTSSGSRSSRPTGNGWPTPRTSPARPRSTRVRFRTARAMCGCRRPAATCPGGAATAISSSSTTTER